MPSIFFYAMKLPKRINTFFKILYWWILSKNMSILLKHVVKSPVLHLRLYLFFARRTYFILQTIQTPLAYCVLT